MVLFDKQDVDLFRLEDLDLKAKAIRNSIIPRLLEVVNSAVEKAGEVYGVEPMEGMTLSFAPRGRERKGVHSARDCKWAYAGLVPQRKKKSEGGWIPVSLRIVLNHEAIAVFCQVNCNEPRFRKRFFKLFRQYETKLLGLLAAMLGQWTVFNGETWTPLFYPLGRSLDAFEDGKICFLSFRSYTIRFPCSERTRGSLEILFVLLYPLFRAACGIASEKTVDLDGMLDSALEYARDYFTCSMPQKPVKANVSKDETMENSDVMQDMESVAELAAERVRVLPGKRWRVFERDGWRCVSCGRGADEGVILEVDHVLPCSKGGGDSLDNLQTLCRECNIGKSNKSDRNLRKRDSRR